MWFSREFYDIRRVRNYLLMMVGFFLLCKFTKGMAYPLLVPMAFYYVSNRQFEKLYFVVLVAISSIVCNGWLMPKTFVFAVTQRGLLVSLGFFLTLMLFGQRNAATISPLRAFFWYVIYMIPVSMYGWSPLISGLKLCLFTAIFFALYSATNGVSLQKHGMRDLRSMVLAFISFFLVGSLLVLPFPSIGNMAYSELLQTTVTNVSLFKGMAVHSQTLGPVVTICGVLLFADLVFSLQRKDKFYVFLLLVVPFLIYKTSSRTAMGSLLGGMCFIFWCTMRTRSIKRSWKSRLVQGGFLFGIVASVLVILLPAARSKAARFVVKYGAEGEQVRFDSESILASRQGKLDGLIDGWRQSPVFGNGFQVSANMQGFTANSIRDVMTAPVEKSTWVYAVLEEGGVIGEIIFSIFALFIIMRLLATKAYIGASCFFTMLVLNLGEFTMFSLSGVGGFILGMVFVGCAMDARRLREMSLLTIY